MFLAIDVGNTHTVVGVSTISGHLERVLANQHGSGNPRFGLGSALSVAGGRRDESTSGRRRGLHLLSRPAGHRGADRVRPRLAEIEPMIGRFDPRLNISLGMDNPHEVGDRPHRQCCRRLGSLADRPASSSIWAPPRRSKPSPTTACLPADRSRSGSARRWKR